VLYARSSKLIPDKANLGFRFPCDGPGRGGTCQSSSWDHVFLGLFWMYNSISVVIFHFSWKMQSDVWELFHRMVVFHTLLVETSRKVLLQLMAGYVISYGRKLQVIQSYGSSSSAYGLIFLGAHFIWAFSLMFLFSGVVMARIIGQSFGLIN
jgi:photosystem I P700 chlorophyll a apoprotein A1